MKNYSYKDIKTKLSQSKINNINIKKINPLQMHKNIYKLLDAKYRYYQIYHNRQYSNINKFPENNEYYLKYQNYHTIKNDKSYSYKNLNLLKLKKNNSINLKNNSNQIIPLIQGKHFRTINEKNNYSSEKITFNPNKNYFILISGNNENLIRKCFKHRENWEEIKYLNLNNKKNCNLIWSPLSNSINFEILNEKKENFKQIVNHFENHNQLTNKLNLFINLLKFCENNNQNLFNFFPLTFPIQFGSINYENQINSFKYLFNNIKNFLNKNNNEKYSNFYNYFNNENGKKIGTKTEIFIPKNFYNNNNLWIIKPINYNRGQFINICNNLNSITKTIKNFYEGNKINILPKINNNNNNLNKENIFSKILIQKYLEDPLLFNGRKFDMRIWVLLNFDMNIYVFKEGHLKSSSELFNLYNNNLYIHLTNYSIQKHNKNFEKFEQGNEISFKDFEKNCHISMKEILPKIYNIINISMKSVKEIINLHKHKFCFELFGYDFIFDKDFNPFLLEINTNPGLEFSSILINKLLPRMIDDLFRLTIDKIFYTKYSLDHIDNNGKYVSSFNVDGYNNNENLWKLIGNIKI